ncbi:uncharacterized protein [Hyperolius riggenbachi]
MKSALSKDWLHGLDQNEKAFQAKMRNIFEKYNHAFEDDIIVNIADFNYIGGEGCVQWEFIPKKTENTKPKITEISEEGENRTLNKTFETEDDSSDEEDLNATCSSYKKTSDDLFNGTFTTGCGPSFAQNSSYSGNESSLACPLEASVSEHMRTFINRHNKTFCFEDTRELSQNDTVLNGPLQSTQMDDSVEDGLGYFYPDMVESFQRLLEFPWKKRAADSIIHHYKRQILKSHKSTLDMKRKMCRPTNAKTMPPNTLCQFKLVNRPQPYNYGSDTSMEGIFTALDYSPTKHKSTIGEIGSPRNKGGSRLSEMACSPVKIYSHSVLHSIHSPKVKLKTVGDKVHPRTLALDRLFIYKGKLQTDEVNTFSGINPFKQLPNQVTSSKTSLHSTIPEDYSPRKYDMPLSPDIGRMTALNKTFIKSNHTEFQETDFRHREQKPYRQTSDTAFSLTRSRSFSGFPSIHYSNSNSKSKCNVYARNNTLDKTFTYQNPVEMDRVNSFSPREKYNKLLVKVTGSPSGRLSLSAPSSPYRQEKCRRKLKLEHTFTNQHSEKIEDKISSIREQKGHLNMSPRRRSFSTSPASRSVNSNSGSLYCGYDETTNLKRRIAYLKMKGGNNSQLGDVSKFSRLVYPLTRSYSASTLPGSPNVTLQIPFEGASRIELHNRPNRNSLSFNAKVQSSDLVCSLVNSPGSQRAKRQGSSIVPSSPFKRHKSFDKTFVIDQATNKRFLL